MKSFTGKKINSTPAKAARGYLRSAKNQLLKISIADGAQAFEKARILHQYLQDAEELAKDLQRLTL